MILRSSIQYLQRPVEVLTEVRRALRKRAPLVISFSNRCFPTKAVAIWRAMGDCGHADLIDLYLRRAGFEDASAFRACATDGTSDPMLIVRGRMALAAPVWGAQAMARDLALD